MDADIYSDAVKCDLCGTVAKTSNDAHRMRWDWFTGRLSKTFHACGICLERREKDVKAKKLEADIHD